MRKDYKAGDIVELLNYEVPDHSRIGYFMNQYGMIPQVGHKYYVAFTSDKRCNGVSLVCGTNIEIGYPDYPKTFAAPFHQVCLYKSVEESK